MTSDTSPSRSGDAASRPDVPPLPPSGPTTTPPTRPEGTAPPPNGAPTTRAAAAWFATAVALVLLVLLIVLILQNPDVVEVHYFGFTGSVALGTALLIAAVAGAAVVTIVGVIRLTQLRVKGRKARRLEAKHGKS